MRMISVVMRVVAVIITMIGHRIGYRTKRNLKAIVYLIAGDVLANSPI
jgi:hypothetical protein